MFGSFVNIMEGPEIIEQGVGFLYYIGLFILRKEEDTLKNRSAIQIIKAAVLAPVCPGVGFKGVGVIASSQGPQDLHRWVAQKTSEKTEDHSAQNPRSYTWPPPPPHPKLINAPQHYDLIHISANDNSGVRAFN